MNSICKTQISLSCKVARKCAMLHFPSEFAAAYSGSFERNFTDGTVNKHLIEDVCFVVACLFL